MTRWDIKATRDLLTRCYGPSQLALARNALRATTVRLDHAAYHFREVRRLLREHIDDKLVERDIYDIAMPGGDEWEVLQDGLLQVEAHMIACAQSIHAVPDAVAHVAFYSAGLNLIAKPIRENKVSLKVLLETGALRFAVWNPVEACLDAMVKNSSLAALDAVVNYNKHRGLPDPTLQLEPNDRAAPYAMQFEAFSFGGSVRPRVEVERLLAPAYAAVSQGAVNAGNAINSALAQCAA
jgi:hypothetical protein